MGFNKIDIAMFRGGFPETCSFCNKPTPPEQLEPEEAGDWACWHCLARWAHEDGHENEAYHYERAIKEAERAAARPH